MGSDQRRSSLSSTAMPAKTISPNRLCRVNKRRSSSRTSECRQVPRILLLSNYAVNRRPIRVQLRALPGMRSLSPAAGVY